MAAICVDFLLRTRITKLDAHNLNLACFCLSTEIDAMGGALMLRWNVNPAAFKVDSVPHGVKHE